MATELRGNGISFGGPIYTQYSSDTAANTVQSKAPAIIKVAIASGPHNIDMNGSSGQELEIGDTELDMGVPSAPDNLYRIWYQTVSDDWNNSTSGCGFKVYRHTPSSGWQAVMAQGSHASYDGNIGDYYRTNNAIFWIPVHPTYGTENHKFKFGIVKHNNHRTRINCTIGEGIYNGSLRNNCVEIWEVNRDSIVSFGGPDAVNDFDPSF